MIKTMITALLLMFCSQLAFGANDSSNRQVHVISKDSGDKLGVVFGLDKKLAGKKIKSENIKIEKSNVQACYKINNKKRFCIKMVYKPENDFRLQFDSTINKNLEREITKLISKRLHKFDGKIWTTALPEQHKLDKSRNDKLNDLLYITRDLLVKEENELAFKTHKLITELFKGDYQPGWLWFRILTQSGKFELAKNWLATHQQDMSDEALLEKTRYYTLLGEIGKALENLQKIKVEKNEPDQRCKFNMFAAQLEHRGQGKLALEARVEALKKFDHCGDLWMELSTQMVELGKSQEMRNMLLPVLKKYPDNPLIVSAMIFPARRLGLMEVSKGLMVRMYELTKEEIWVTLHSTVVSQMKGSEWNFEATKKAHLDDPDNLLKKHALAVLSYYADEYQESIRLCDELKKVIPNEPRLYIYGAMSRYESGDWEGARKWLDDLDVILSKGTLNEAIDPDLYYCHAILWHQKDPEKALKYLDVYLSQPLNPIASALKRKKAFMYRDQLAKGETIGAWIPYVHRPWYYATFPPWLIFGGGGFAFCLIVLAALYIRRMKNRKQ